MWLPKHLPLEPGFLLSLKSIQHLHQSIGGNLDWFLEEQEEAMIRRLQSEGIAQIPGNFRRISSHDSSKEPGPEDSSRLNPGLSIRESFLPSCAVSGHLPLIFCPRDGSISYHPEYADLPRHLGTTGLLMLYPSIPTSEPLQRLHNIETALPETLRRQMERLQGAADVLKEWIPDVYNKRYNS